MKDQNKYNDQVARSIARKMRYEALDMQAKTREQQDRLAEQSNRLSKRIAHTEKSKPT